MRVVMVSDVFFPRINGVSTAIQTYRESLLPLGIEVSLVAPDYGGECGKPGEDWVRRVRGRRVPGDPEDRLVSWRAMHQTVGKAVAGGCDLVHIQTPFVAHYAGVRAARQHDVPVLATYHTLFEEYLGHYVPLVPAGWLKGLARRFSRSQCNALDAVIVPSAAISRRLADYGVKAAQHVLPTGVNLNAPPPDARRRFRARYDIPDDCSVALYVGRVAHEKNIDFLLDVAEHMREWAPGMRLIIAGDGPALPGLRRSVADRGLSERVGFIGYLDRASELPACYAAADVFVFASRTETQGLVLLEAMACGLPVVALAEMGTIDILAAQRGALVPDGNPYAFSLALSRILNDGVLRRRLSAEARVYAAEWSSGALAGRMAAVYRQLAGRKTAT